MMMYYWKIPHQQSFPLLPLELLSRLSPLPDSHFTKSAAITRLSNLCCSLSGLFFPISWKIRPDMFNTLALIPWFPFHCI